MPKFRPKSLQAKKKPVPVYPPKKRPHFLLITLGTLAALVLLTAVIILNVFTLDRITLKGNKFYESTVITDAVLNDENSWNTLYVYLKYRFREPEAIPFIDTMDISIDGPHSLTITVYEKGLLGYLYINSLGQNAYFDKDGLVAETSPKIIQDVPKVNGISCDEVVLYEQLPIKSTTLRGLLTLTQALKRNEIEPEEITYGVTNAPVLTYGSIQVVIGSTNELTQKVERMAAILPMLEGESGVLHMEDWTAETSDIIFDRNEFIDGVPVGTASSVEENTDQAEETEDASSDDTASETGNSQDGASEDEASGNDLAGDDSAEASGN